jgi:hypothetical protein
MWVLSAVISAFIAALVTISVSFLVECAGGIVGGTIGTVPHVAVVGSIGFSLVAAADSSEFQVAMLVMPIGMLNNSFFLAALRLSSHYWRTRQATPRFRAAAVFSCSCVLFLLIVVLIVFLLKPETLRLDQVRVLAFCSFILEFVIGYVLFKYFPSNATTAKNKSSRLSIFLRGCCTFVLFFIAMALAQSFPAVSGILVNLPIVGTVIVSSIWLSQSEECAMSTIAPMVLGMLSASFYAMLTSYFMPLIGTAGGAVLSWFISVGCVTFPVLMFLQKHRKALSPNKDAAMSELANPIGRPIPKGAGTDVSML